MAVGSTLAFVGRRHARYSLVRCRQWLRHDAGHASADFRTVFYYQGNDRHWSRLVGEQRDHRQAQCHGAGRQPSRRSGERYATVRGPCSCSSFRRTGSVYPQCLPSRCRPKCRICDKSACPNLACFSRDRDPTALNRSLPTVRADDPLYSPHSREKLQIWGTRVVSGMGSGRSITAECVGGSMQRGACSAGANFDRVTCRRLMRM